MVQGQEGHPGAKADTSGPSGDGSQGHQGRRAIAIVDEVVLGDEHGIVAQPLDFLYLLQQGSVQLREGAPPPLRVAEVVHQSELYGPYLSLK
jgi:hypothetical protein